MKNSPFINFKGAGGRQAFANSGNSMGIAHYRRSLKIYFSAMTVLPFS
jgi:hypothetical protein